MTRKPNVSQEAVNAACQKLQADERNVTVNAVIQLTGGLSRRLAEWLPFGRTSKRNKSLT